jgi:hypothetical protein
MQISNRNPFVRRRMKGVISPVGSLGELHRLAETLSIESMNTDNRVRLSSRHGNCERKNKRFSYRRNARLE